jgi:hypothetical protein
MGEYFEGVFYEERALPYMGLTLICGSVIAVSVFFIVLSCKHKFDDKKETAICSLYCSVFALVWGLGLWRGYSSPNHHGKVKEEISNYYEAVEWNDEEREYNTYFFRFTLREENIIDLSKFEESGNALQ